MCCQPGTPLPAVIDTRQSGTHLRTDPQLKYDRSPVDSQSSDLESNEKGNEASEHAANLDVNHYRMVNEVWYYCSVDWGSKCELARGFNDSSLTTVDLCIGYNSLSQLDAKSLNDDQAANSISNKPEGRRLWTWLIHCYDGAVFHIQQLMN